LFGRSHVEQVEPNLWIFTGENFQRFGQELKIEPGQVSNIKLPRFSTIETLHSAHTLLGKLEQMFGINQKAPALLSQCHPVLGPV